MLDQRETSKLFKQCAGDPVAIEEVLSAYVVWKYVKGRTPGHILTRLRYLKIYLHVMGQDDILTVGYQAFALVKLEVGLGGESRIGLTPAKTLVGKEIWNRLRQRMTTAQIKRMTDGLYGGAMPTQAFIPAQHQGPVELGMLGIEPARRPGWVQQHFHRREQFGHNDVLPTYGQAATAGQRVDGEVVVLPTYELPPGAQESQAWRNMQMGCM